MDRLTAQLEDKKTLLASIGQMFPAEMQGAVQSYLATLEGQKELNTMFMWGVDDMRAAMLDESWDDMPMEAKLWFTSGDLCGGLGGSGAGNQPGLGLAGAGL